MLDKDLIPKEVIYSKRKTISLIVNSHGELIVRAPKRVSKTEITNFILKKASWIRSKKQDAKANDKYSPILMRDGDIIYILGQQYVLKFTNTKKIVQETGILYLPINTTKDELIKYLKKFTKIYIKGRLDYYHTTYGLNYNNLKISSARSCWGSCNYKNDLSFTYKLIFCDPNVIDYIVVHELAHTIFKNHSKEFWQKVELILPDYKSRKNWLKDNRGLIDLI